MESKSSQISDVNISDLGSQISDVRIDVSRAGSGALTTFVHQIRSESEGYRRAMPPRAWIMGTSVGWERGPNRRQLGTLGHATLGTPTRATTELATPRPRRAGRSVLWALNWHCVTLKSVLKSIWSRLSAFWPSF